MLSEVVYLWMVIIILFRDLSITFLRVVFKSRSDLVLVTTKIAKLKTLSQLVAIIWILFSLAYPDLSFFFESSSFAFQNLKLLDFGYHLMLIATFFTLYTGLHYYYNNGRKIIHVLSNR